MPAAADGVQAVKSALGEQHVVLRQSDVGKTYTYKVVEVVGEKVNGYTYDTTEYTVTVMAWDDPQKAALTVTTEVTGPEGIKTYVYGADPSAAGTGPAVVPFANAYAASTDNPGGTAAQVTATKDLTGRPLSADEFTFAVKYATGGDDLRTAKNTADGTVTFDALHYTTEMLEGLVKDGNASKTSDKGVTSWTVSYLAYEKTDGLAGQGVTPQTQPIPFTVTVVDNGDGSLTATANLDKGLKFENTYSTGDPVQVGLSGVKMLQAAPGLAPASIEGKFTFTVTSDDAAAPMPERTTAKNAADGSVDFGTIEFTLDDLNRALGVNDQTAIANADKAEADVAKAADQVAAPAKEADVDAAKAADADASRAAADADKVAASADNASAQAADEGDKPAAGDGQGAGAVAASDAASGTVDVVAPDNKPADYAPENRPYKAEKFLKVSLNGYDEADFAMIMGFPGSTQRYMTSYEIDRMLEVENPQRIFIRGERQAILKEDMAASDKVRIQYASKYAQSSNYWKNSIGMSRGIKRLDVKGRKQEQEAAFRTWAAKNTLPTEGYVDALDKIRESVEETLPSYASLQYLQEAFLRAVEILTPARYSGSLKGAELEKALKGFYKDYNMPTDRRVAKRMFRIVKENCKELPSVFAEVIDKRFGGDTDAYVDYLYDNSVFADEQRALAAVASGKELKEDPAAVLSESIVGKMRELSKAQKEGRQKYADGHRLYIAGLMRMQPKKAWASDANFTIRLTYGRILPYNPADGIRYNYYTTLKGVMEKENPENPTEFTVPAKLKELYAAKDFGRYANAKGELPTCFLADCDITGGNSGSPVLNAKGSLIGLAFDGNWEAMSGDVAFEPELQRTIAVDVRYVLFVIDKFAGAGWLLDELQFE